MKIDIDALKNRLLDESLIEDAASAYIEDPGHTARFLQCFMEGFQYENKNSEYDFVEVFDCDQVEISNIHQVDKMVEIDFIIDYLLSVWRGDKQLARITASAKGICLCVVDEHNHIDPLVIKEMYNQCEEYDDYTMLFN